MEHALLADRTMRELRPSLVRNLSSLRRTRPILFAAGIVTGTAISALLVAIVWWRMTPPPPVEPTTIVVTVERPAPPEPAPPPAPPPPAATPSKCPAIAVPDDAIGTAIKPEAVAGEDAKLSVVAAANAPQVAVLSGREVFVSDNLGRGFHRTFADRAVDEIALGRDGVLYARAGTALGYRIPEGDTGWREATVAQCSTDSCRDRIAAFGDRIAWMHDDELAVSSNEGRTWHGIPRGDFAWASTEGHTFEWGGSLYEVQHFTDMCGVDDYDAWRLTGDKIEHEIFHDHYIEGNPHLVASDEASTQWSWQVRCRLGDPAQLGACPDPIDRRMFIASMLRPVSGARLLALHGPTLVELCGNEAHQIYRTFPFAQLDAVDSAGRPLVVRGNTLVHWSPAHGWRRLFVAR